MRRKTLRLVTNLLLILLGALLLTLVILPPDKALWLNSQLVIENLLPIVVMTFLIYCLSGRVFGSIGIVGILVIGIRYLHDEKIAILEAPLISSDFLLLGQVFVSPSLVFNYVRWPIILGAGFLLLLLVFVFFRETSISRFRSRTIAAAVLLLALVLIRTPLGLYYTELPKKPWEPDPSLRKAGIAAYLIQDYLLVNAMQTPTANKLTIATTKTQYQLPGTTPISEQKPDIILWLSESFFDPRIFKDINSCEQIPTYCEMVQQNFNGSITVPTFGGETIRTEFEILTGVPMTAVAEHHYPYMSLTNVPVNSIAWELRKQGYDTVAVHNHQRRFWRRTVALKNLGFQRWIGVENMKEAKLIGRYHADRMLTDTVFDLLEEPKDNLPQLIFAISMQAHGPYGNQPRLPDDQVESIAVPQALGAENVRTLQQFFYHLNNADKELHRLANYINSRERPTLVLYFGDHLPGLGQVYDDLKFENELGARQQKTPFLLFSNYPTQFTDQPTPDLAAWQLATLTLKTADLLGDGAFAWFNVLYDEQQWSQEGAAKCQTPVCDALLQFQYQQLAGPESEAIGPSSN